MSDPKYSTISCTKLKTKNIFVSGFKLEEPLPLILQFLKKPEIKTFLVLQKFFSPDGSFFNR